MTREHRLSTEAYCIQHQRWPSHGCHILAHFDQTNIVVYQAYNAPIAEFAMTHGFLGGDFRLTRMSWIKPNFLWMMYRSGWATKPGQTHILALWLRRTAFDTIVSQAVHSHFVPDLYPDQESWKHMVNQSEVVLQWDPDHHPSGAKLQRRAIQLGLRGTILARYTHEWIVHIEDISSFVHEQHYFTTTKQYHHLVIPCEEIYPISDANTAKRLGMSAFS